MIKSAEIDPTGLYRYSLYRGWETNAPKRIAFVMLNPSRADATNDDPTLCRCISFARSWGYGSPYHPLYVKSNTKPVFYLF
ncbi:MAG: DUF1643 domain-containing protein [Planktothrix rubescens PR222]